MTTRWPLSDGPFPGSESGPAPITERDLLTDLAEVLRGHTGRVRLADVPTMLRKLDPSWAPQSGT